MNTISKPWNGYSITNRGVNNLFYFECKNCDFTLKHTFKENVDLLLFRLKWKRHVDTHGGPYA